MASFLGRHADRAAVCYTLKLMSRCYFFESGKCIAAADKHNLDCGHLRPTLFPDGMAHLMCRSQRAQRRAVVNLLLLKNVSYRRQIGRQERGPLVWNTILAAVVIVGACAIKTDDQVITW
jgi:hypothetical protein